MRDTPIEIEQRVIEMMRTRTPEERLAMVSAMYHAGKTLVIAGMRARQPRLDPAQERIELFRRMYGMDFTAEELDRICHYLVTHAPQKDGDDQQERPA